MANKVDIVITATDKASGKIGKVGGGLADLGQKAAIGIGLAGVAAAAAGAAAIGMAASFQEGMNEVATLAPDVEANIGALRAGVLGLSTELGTNAVESTKALYQAISAGVPAGSAIEFLEIASQAAIGGVTDTETAVDGLTTVMNAFSSQNIDAEKAADVMFATVKAGKTNFAQLSASMFQVAPLANAAGVSFEEVSAALATITAQGTPTAVATTQIRSAIEGIINPSKAMNKIFRDAGFASGELALEQLGLAGAADILVKATGGSNAELKKLLGTADGMQAILGISGDNADSFAENMDGMANSAGAADKAFGIMEKGFTQQMKKLKAGFQSIVIQIGAKLIPVIQPLVEWLGKKLPWAFATVSQFITAKLIPAFTTIKDWLGDKLVPVFATAWRWLQEKIPAAFATVTAFITDKMIPAIRPLVEWYAEKLTGAFDKVKTFIDDTLIPAFATVKEWITATLIPAIEPLVEWLGEKLPVAFGKVAAWVDSTLIPAFDKVKTFIDDTLIPALGTLQDWLGEKLGPVFESIQKWFGEKIPAAFEVATKFIDDTLVPGLQKVKDWVGDKLGPAFDGLQKWFGEKIPAAFKVATKFIDEKLVPAFATIKEWLGEKLPEVFAGIKAWMDETLPAAFKVATGFIDDTLVPAFDKIKEWLGETLPEVFESIVEWFQDKIPEALDTIVTWVEDNEDDILDFFTDVKTVAEELWLSLQAGVVVVLEWLKSFALWFVDNKPAIIIAITAIGVAIFIALGPVSQAALAITGIITLIGFLKRNWDNLKRSMAAPLKATIGGSRVFENLGGVRQGLAAAQAVTEHPLFDRVLGRAHGGPVAAGAGYMVGERGPETFIPNVSGRIMPNGAGAGAGMGGGMVVNVSLTVHGNLLAQRDMEDAVVEGVIEARRRGRI